ncbi:MAG: TadG family pilus assembly protein [Bdellovibrionota bacterium]
MKSNPSNPESGSILIFFTIVISLLFAFVALVAGLGNAMRESRAIQAATDASAFAAASIVGDTYYTDDQVKNYAKNFAEINGINLSSEINGYVEVGNYTYNSSLKTHNFTSGGTPRNAVRVPTRRNVDTWFSSVVDFNQVRTKAHTVAVGPDVTGNCVKPFGFSNQILGVFTPGTVITVGSETPGNWGKVDVDGNMSSGPNFASAMYNDTCNTTVNVGSQFSPGTGSSGTLKTIFQTLFNSGDREMTLLVVDGFPNGNNGVVTVEKFALADLVAVSDLGGSRWTADLQINVLLDHIPVAYAAGSKRKIVLAN